MPLAIISCVIYIFIIFIFIYIQRVILSLRIYRSQMAVVVALLFLSILYKVIRDRLQFFSMLLFLIRWPG